MSWLAENVNNMVCQYKKITIETKLNNPSQSTEQAADSDKVSAEKAEAMKPLPVNSKKPQRVRLHAHQNNKHDRKVLDFSSSDEFPTEIIVKSSGKNN